MHVELTYDGEGGNTSTLTNAEEPAYASDFGEVDGIIVIYGTDEVVGRLPARIRQAKYPFALSAWTDLIDDGTVKRVEIAAMPALEDADGNTLALDAPSRTFDLGANDFDDGFYSPIAKVEDGCETCHDALATNNHSPDRGGNIVVCRLCHITKSRGSHLEMQSRSIDGDVPLYITGPAGRACGSCHKAELINEDANAELIMFDHHIKQGGYLIEGGEEYVDTLLGVIDEIMTLFGQ